MCDVIKLLTIADLDLVDKGVTVVAGIGLGTGLVIRAGATLQWKFAIVTL